MEPKPVLLCDMDSIVADLLGKTLSVYNRENNTSFNTTHLTDWDMTQCLPKHGLKMVQMFHREGFFADLEPLPGAIEGLRELTKFFDVILLTVPTGAGSASDKYRWMERHLPFLGKNIMIVPHKYLVRGDVLIDDAPHHIDQYSEAWPEAFIAAIAYPYNEACREKVNTWAHDHANTAGAWQKIVSDIKQHFDFK